jgi:hypothetical protein
VREGGLEGPCLGNRETGLLRVLRVEGIVMGLEGEVVVIEAEDWEIEASEIFGLGSWLTAAAAQAGTSLSFLVPDFPDPEWLPVKP